MASSQDSLSCAPLSATFRSGLSRISSLVLCALVVGMSAAAARAQTLSVVPDDNTTFVFSGVEGGPFLPETPTAWTLSDSDLVGLDFTVTSDQPWLAVSPSSGTIVGAGTQAVSAVLNPAQAAALAAGSYVATVTFHNVSTNAGTTTRTVQLDVEPSSFTVSPIFVNAQTAVAGQNPAPATVTLSNSGAGVLNYSLAWTAQTWFSVNKVGGTVPSNGSDAFTVTFNTLALAAGTYVEEIDVENTTNGLGSTTVVLTLIVGPAAPILTISQLTEGGTIVASPGGTLLQDGAVQKIQYGNGEVVTLSVSLADGYQFDGWSGDVVAEDLLNNPVAITMDGPKSVSAKVSRLQRTLNLSVTGSGTGTIRPTPNGTFEDNALIRQYVDGTSVALQADADAGAIFVGWSGNLPEGSQSVNPLTVLMDRERTITARFEQKTDLTVSTNGNGEVVIEPELSQYYIGATVTLIAVADPGYKFTGWTGSVEAAEEELLLVLDGPKNIVANFALSGSVDNGGGNDNNTPPPTDMSVTLTVNVDGQGVVTPGGGEYSAGDTVTLIATPDVGWVFVGYEGGVNSSDEVVSLTLNADTTVTARFELSSDSGQPAPVGLCGATGLSFLPLSLACLGALRRTRFAANLP